MKIKRMKLCAFAFIALIGGCLFAQENGGWVSPYVGLSTLNNDNKVADLYGGQSKVLNSWSMGYELGYRFGNNLSFFTSIAEENADMSKDSRCLKTKATTIELNFAYPIVIFGKNAACFIEARIGVGVYNDRIETTKIVADLPTETSIVQQNYNLMIPMGLSLNVPIRNHVFFKSNLLYRYSIDTGKSKFFGGSSAISDYPFDKLGSLYLTIGLGVGI